MSNIPFLNAVVTATFNSIEISVDGKTIFSLSGNLPLPAIYLKPISEEEEECRSTDFSGIFYQTKITRIPQKCELHYWNYSFQISICDEDEYWSEFNRLSIYNLIHDGLIFPIGYDVSQLLTIYE